jgi:hypothetical protein
MSRKAKRGIVVSGLSIAVTMTALYAIVFLTAKGVTQEEAAMPSLFALT